MKQIALLIIIIITGCNTEYDYSFPEVLTRQIDHYAVNDTIYFKSNTNDLDTIAVTDRISEITRGTGFYPPQNDMGIMIHDLPLAKGEHNYKRKHAFVFLKKYGDDSYLNIRYKGFLEMLKLKDLEGKGDIITIKTSKPQQQLTPETIIEVQWSLSRGLLGYTKLSGERYEIVSPNKLHMR